jgi:hypothetical protein
MGLAKCLEQPFAKTRSNGRDHPLVFAGLLIAAATTWDQARAAQVTFRLAGAMSPAAFDFGVDFDPGYAFSGYYMFESTMAGMEPPDGSLVVQ